MQLLDVHIVVFSLRALASNQHLQIEVGNSGASSLIGNETLPMFVAVPAC